MNKNEYVRSQKIKQVLSLVHFKNEKLHSLNSHDLVSNSSEKNFEPDLGATAGFSLTAS